MRGIYIAFAYPVRGFGVFFALTYCTEKSVYLSRRGGGGGNIQTLDVDQH
jgi:hypothetical protein